MSTNKTNVELERGESVILLNGGLITVTSAGLIRRCEESGFKLVSKSTSASGRLWETFVVEGPLANLLDGYTIRRLEDGRDGAFAVKKVFQDRDLVAEANALCN